MSINKHIVGFIHLIYRLSFPFLILILVLLMPIQSGAATCIEANPNDNLPDDDALQACLQKGGMVSLSPGNPGYVIAKGIRITVSGTVLTSEQAPTKATLIADSQLKNTMLVTDSGIDNFRLSYLRIDGNRFNRDKSACSGNRGAWSNVSITNSSGFVVTNIESSRALCGTSFGTQGVVGSNFEIAYSEFYDNGASTGGPDPWADGITLGICDHGYVHHNIVENSTDIGIVSGGGRGCRVENNTIRQTREHAFAGLAIHNFLGPNWNGMGDHTDAIYQKNSISSLLNLLDIGISVGMNGWGISGTHGGFVINNTATGAQVNLSVDGYSNGTVDNNTLSNPQGGCNLNYAVAYTSNSCLQPGWVIQSVRLGTYCSPTEETIISTCNPSPTPTQTPTPTPATSTSPAPPSR